MSDRITIFPTIKYNKVDEISKFVTFKCFTKVITVILVRCTIN